MNLIHTDDFINIYNEVLYEGVNEPDASYECLGNTLSEIAIFILKKEHSEANLQFIAKMMQACKLSESDYLIAIVPHEKAFIPVYNKAKKEINIFFGLQFKNDGFAMRRELNKPFRFQGLKLLLSNSLAELTNDTTLKSALWNKGLKVLFNIA